MTALQTRPEIPESETTGLRDAARWLVVAAVASIGAGAIHFAAAGAHGEHRGAVYVFTLLALLQVGWGVAAALVPSRRAGWAGIAVGLAAVGGWVVAKLFGLWFIPGLDEAEPVQLADGAAAALAVIATCLSILAVLPHRSRPRLHVPVLPLAVLLAAVALVGAIATSGHQHAGHDQADHDHADGSPWDPALPIDLGGTPGVTPKQQADAENLVAVTLVRLPQWTDPKFAERSGFFSAGDGNTGFEHLINAEYLGDDRILDPDHPESLVYDVRSGKRTLVGAMFMLDFGTTLDDVPNIGGPLIQWHTHDNLCNGPQGTQIITDLEAGCPAGTSQVVAPPMVHVWITKNRCGPFASLEGEAGGTVKAGETKLCDHTHGSV